MKTSNPPPEPTETIIEPDPRFRRWVLLALALTAAVGGGLIYLFERYQISRAITTVEDANALTHTFQWMIYSGAGVSFLVSLWLGRLAYAIFEAKRFPLPHQKVLVPTPLRTGFAARRVAVGFGLLAALLATMGGTMLYLSVVVTRMIEQAR